MIKNQIGSKVILSSHRKIFKAPILYKNFTSDHFLDTLDDFECIRAITENSKGAKATSRLANSEDNIYLKRLRLLKLQSDQYSETKPLSQLANLSDQGRQIRKRGDQLSDELKHKITKLLKRRTTDLELKNWIDIHASNKSQANLLLNAIVDQASLIQLPAIMKLISSQKDSLKRSDASIALGEFDSRRSVQLFELVIMKALEVDRVTFNDISSLEEFNTFFYSFSRLEIKKSRILDIWLRFVCKFGDFESASAYFKVLVMNKVKLSKESSNAFLRVLSEHAANLPADQVREFIIERKQFLRVVPLSPQMAQLLLSAAKSTDDLYQCLELFQNSEASGEISNKCQPSILRAAFRISHAETGSVMTAMAHMFGVMNRFETLSEEALDECLLLSAKYGSASGIYRALSARAHQTSKAPDEKILVRVFDKLPLRDNDFVKEMQHTTALQCIHNSDLLELNKEEIILSYLRKLVDSEHSLSYQKFIAALGRGNNISVLREEWNKANSANLDQDLAVEFVSAFRSADTLDESYSVLKSILEHGNKSSFLVKRLLDLEILPVNRTLTFLARWLLQNSRQLNWSMDEIEMVFSTTSDLKKGVCDIILQVRNGRDPAISLNMLDTLLEEQAPIEEHI